MPDLQSKPLHLFLINLAPSFWPAKTVFFNPLVTVSLMQHDSCKIPSNNLKNKRKESPPSTEHSPSTCCYYYYTGWGHCLFGSLGFSLAHKTQNNVLKVASC